jgi:dihydroorotase
MHLLIYSGLKNEDTFREGYFADLVLVDPNQSWVVSPENILYKCGWSPFEGFEFSNKVVTTYINGAIAFENDKINESVKGKRVLFN